MSNSQKITSDISFEEALKELEEIVKKLEKGEKDLNEAIKLYEKGSLLKKHCEKRLNDAEMLIKKIVEESDGKIVLEDFEFKDK